MTEPGFARAARIIRALDVAPDRRRAPLDLAGVALALYAGSPVVWEWATQRIDLHVRGDFPATMLATIGSYLEHESPDYMPETCWIILSALAESAQRHCAGAVS